MSNREWLTSGLEFTIDPNPKFKDNHMAVFNEEDRQTVKSLALTMAGFAALTVFLILCALFIT